MQKKIFSWLADSATTKKNSKFVEQREKKKNSAETFFRENVARILKHPSAV